MICSLYCTLTCMLTLLCTYVYTYTYIYICCSQQLLDFGLSATYGEGEQLHITVGVCGYHTIYFKVLKYFDRGTFNAVRMFDTRRHAYAWLASIHHYKVTLYVVLDLNSTAYTRIQTQHFVYSLCTA